MIANEAVRETRVTENFIHIIYWMQESPVII